MSMFWSGKLTPYFRLQQADRSDRSHQRLATSIKSRNRIFDDLFAQVTVSGLGARFPDALADCTRNVVVGKLDSFGHFFIHHENPVHLPRWSRSWWEFRQLQA